MSAIGNAVLANAGPIIGRVIRAVKSALDIPDDVEAVIEAIERHMPQAIEIANDFARAEMLRAQAQMVQAEAALLHEYGELMKIKLAIILAESARDLRRQRALQERHLEIEQSLMSEVNEAMRHVLTLVERTLRTQIPDYVTTVEKPLLRLLPPPKATSAR